MTEHCGNQPRVLVSRQQLVVLKRPTVPASVERLSHVQRLPNGRIRFVQRHCAAVDLLAPCSRAEISGRQTDFREQPR